jgi:isoprenylcysteine carboxyl methyltransferase (ICMT) family protein YpbQ
MVNVSLMVVFIWVLLSLSSLFTERPHQINNSGDQQYAEKEENEMVLLHNGYVLSHLEKKGKMNATGQLLITS